VFLLTFQFPLPSSDCCYGPWCFICSIFPILDMSRCKCLCTTYRSVYCVHLCPECPNRRSPFLEFFHVVVAVCNRAATRSNYHQTPCKCKKNQLIIVSRNTDLNAYPAIRNKSVQTCYLHYLINPGPHFWKALCYTGCSRRRGQYYGRS
jgi:hypothetical protein